MITALLLTALTAQQANIPAEIQPARDSLPIEALNMLLDYPAAYAELRRCGRPVITAVDTKETAAGLTQFVFNGYHLQGDIILGDFAMDLTVVSSDPELGFTQYNHEMNLKYDGLFACALNKKNKK